MKLPLHIHFVVEFVQDNSQALKWQVTYLHHSSALPKYSFQVKSSLQYLRVEKGPMPFRLLS
jgi:hypothetical protein